jgi:hypothetical protein
MGLAFDEWDLDYYTKLFQDMGRDPTNVELFDIAQARRSVPATLHARPGKGMRACERRPALLPPGPRRATF